MATVRLTKLWATLNSRERVAFECIRLGYTNQQIAKYMGLQLDMAKQYVHRVIQKLQLTHRIEVVYQYRLESLEDWIERKK